MNTAAQIVSDLRLVQDAGLELGLLNLYKGVPFTTRASLLEIDENRIRLAAQDVSLVCVSREKHTTLLSKGWLEPVRAEVLSCDIQSGQVELGNFTFLSEGTGERLVMRVEPAEPLPVSVNYAAISPQGELLDLSMQGAGVRLMAEGREPAPGKGTQVELQIHLPQDQVRMLGQVIDVKKMDGSYRLAVRFTGTAPGKGAVLRYMIARRAEIEAEVRSLFAARASK